WGEFESAIVGTTWDYAENRRYFLRALHEISQCTRLLNPLSTIERNISKHYLQNLQKRGVPTIPTIWVDTIESTSLGSVMDAFRTDKLVAKPNVGASGIGQFVIDRHNCASSPAAMVSEEYLLQPFVNSIMTTGEISLIFVGGNFSHALRKRTTGNEYRV